MTCLTVQVQSRLPLVSLTCPVILCTNQAVDPVKLVVSAAIPAERNRCQRQKTLIMLLEMDSQHASVLPSPLKHRIENINLILGQRKRSMHFFTPILTVIRVESGANLSV